MAICIVKRKLSRIAWHVHVYVDGSETRMLYVSDASTGLLVALTTFHDDHICTNYEA